METQEDVERWVLAVCQEIGLRADSTDADFFEAGGNSLSAMRIISQAEEKYGEDALPPDDLFARSRIGDIAKSIIANSTSAGAPAEG
ncbi:acyl carrier protein [Streptomyces sp. NBRC 110611]|uniref:acyl carrier protein n=1 Tax=Streptomyces sp. NBRC 110611 TaxID=1621259 RepID=UPI000833FCA5|nr:acyl carrier protein [Streptomyces sp. NBRC 110611]